jgi:16S rRNA (cytosine967-C5)-methyltransferase
VAVAAATAPLEGRDERWLDLCAGPGGKSALLAALAAERGAGLVASERQEHRARLVRRALRGTERAEQADRAGRAGEPLTDGAVGVVTADGTLPPYRPGFFDRVLVDAPCTGLGALRRRPEARWRRRADDLLELVVLQRRLLSAALDVTRPGGVVLYSTCSPVLSETRGVVESVLDDRSDAELADASHLLPGIPDCAGPLPGTLQLWPHRHGTDAMFLAVLRRRA